MKKIKISLILVIVFILNILTISNVSAFNDFGLDDTARHVNAFNSQVGNTTPGVGFFQNRLGQMIGLVLSMVGVIFFILIIYAGITWMLSGGNDQTITKSKDLIINATIGLVIVFAAYAITAYVGTLLTSQITQP